MLAKNPGFAAVAVVTLALGIGANTSIFSVVDAVLLRPLPYARPERLVLVDGNYLKLGMEKLGASGPEFIDYRGQNQVFDQIAAFNNVDFNLTGGDEPERVEGARASAGLFPLLGIKPMLGRALAPEENQAGRDAVVVLGHGIWQRRFGSDPGMVGKTLTLDGRSYTVVGIMPPGFQFPHPSFRFARPADLWVPLDFSSGVLRERSRYTLTVLARLKSGVTLEQARADMSAIGSRLEQQYPDYHGPKGEDAGWRVTVDPLGERVAGSTRPRLLVLLGAVGFVLLIACANVANLLLARAAGREREIAIRAALGAGRSRLIRQLLVESMLIALLGGVLGVFLALWGNGLLLALGPAEIPRLREISLDARVLGFSLILALLTGVLFGLIPAFGASRLNLNTSLKEGGRSLAGGSRHHRARSLLVVSEVAVALVLLVGAGLMIKSFVRLLQVNPGFDPNQVLTMEISLPSSKYPEDRARAAFFDQVLERTEALPGVQAAGAAGSLPLTGPGFGGPFSIEGRPFDPTRMPPFAVYQAVSPGYFRAMRIPLRTGRWFTNGDAAGSSPVVVISETLARVFFPNEDPIGRRIKLGAPGSPRPWRAIVGVAGDVADRGLAAPPRLQMYVSSLQDPAPEMTLVVRSASDPASLASAVRSVVWAVDKGQPVSNVRTMQSVLSDSVSERRFAMLLLVVFAAVALVLAAVGIYGVISYSVGQRTHEIGVRMALGAERGDVLRLVVGQGFRLALIGVAVGVAGALALTRLMSSLLYGVRPTDPAIFAFVSLLLAGVALVASYIPAWRATKVDPMVALRYE